jgi:sugar/nucleoside kinase (ribokinase family)
VTRILAIGSVTLDRLADGDRPGGSALYGATAAAALGLETAVAASTAQGFDPFPPASGVRFFRSPSGVTSTFEHRYDAEGRRSERWAALADPVSAGAIPGDWRTPDLAMFGPNVHDVPPEAVGWVTARWTALLPQGWFRTFHPDGRITFGPPRWAAPAARVSLIVASETDVAGDPAAWGRLAAFADVAVLTRGRKGHRIEIGGTAREFAPPYVAEEVDPTGAGDVFATAMLVALSEGADPYDAARLGSAAASFAVEKPGTGGIEGREGVLRRLKR